MTYVEDLFTPGAMVMSMPALLSRAISGSVALTQSVLMSVALVTTKGPEDTERLGPHLWPCWCLRDTPPQVIQIWVAHAATGGHGDVWVQGLVAARVCTDVVAPLIIKS